MEDFYFQERGRVVHGLTPPFNPKTEGEREGSREDRGMGSQSGVEEPEEK